MPATPVFKLKRLRVNVSRSPHIGRPLSELRDQIPLKRCAVRVERYNMEKLNINLDDECTDTSTIVHGNFYNGHKLRRLCVRVPRINCIARSDISSRATSVIQSETDVQEFLENGPIY